MFRVAVKLALAAVAVWAVWIFVPIHDRTLAQRWTSAGSFSTFLENGWLEATGGTKPRPPVRSRTRSAARSRPSEGHTEADRRAVDRILAERLSDSR